MPIYVASLGPANLRLAGALADGWMATRSSPKRRTPSSTSSGRARRERRRLADLDLLVAVGLELTDDVESAGRRHAEGYAFTFGAMGSSTRNFYNDAFARQGYGDDVAEVQRLWLAGDREAAKRRVPIAIGLGTNLIGTDGLVTERLRRYHDAGVTTLRVGLNGSNHDELDDLAHLLDLVRAVNDEAITSDTRTQPQ